MLTTSPSPDQTDPRPPGGAAERSARRRRVLHRLLLGSLALTTLIVVGVLVFVGMLFWSFSGGWDGLRREAQPDDRRVVAARAAVSDTLDPANAQVLAAISPITGAPVATGSADACARGQNNWKIRNGWTLSCEAAAVSLTALPDSSETTLTSLNAALRGAGYAPEQPWEELQMGASTGSGIFHGPDGTTVKIAINEPPAPGEQAYFSTALYPYGTAYQDEDLLAVTEAREASTGTTMTLAVSTTYFKDD